MNPFERASFIQKMEAAGGPYRIQLRSFDDANGVIFAPQTMKSLYEPLIVELVCPWQTPGCSGSVKAERPWSSLWMGFWESPMGWERHAENTDVTRQDGVLSVDVDYVACCPNGGCRGADEIYWKGEAADGTAAEVEGEDNE